MALPAAVALSGLNKSYFSDDLCDVYDKGALLLKSPSLCSIESSEGSVCSQESGFSSMTSECSAVRNLGAYFELLFRTHKLFQNASDSGFLNDSDLQAKPEKPKTPVPKPDLKLIYANRDILDLGANLRLSQDFFTPAKLQDGVDFFFENRSQYSRISGVTVPDHVMTTCKQCGYNQPEYK